MEDRTSHICIGCQQQFLPSKAGSVSHSQNDGQVNGNLEEAKNEQSRRSTNDCPYLARSTHCCKEYLQRDSQLVKTWPGSIMSASYKFVSQEGTCLQ